MLNFPEGPWLCDHFVSPFTTPFSPMKRYPLELFLNRENTAVSPIPGRHCFPSLARSSFCFSLSLFLVIPGLPFRPPVPSVTGSTSSFSPSPKQFNQSPSRPVPSVLSVSPARCFSFICTRACGRALRQLLLWTNGNLNNPTGKPC